MPLRRWLGGCFLGTIALGASLAYGTAVSAQPPAADKTASIVIDAATGRVLEADNPDALRRPASLTKLMTLYITFEALRDRRISLQQAVPFSAHAASMEPTKLGVPAGNVITVEDAILSMVTLSANDAASAMGEVLGGSEDRFGQLMTLRARALGMTHTTFMNASGLPDPDQWTTARDMAILARHLITDFPQQYGYFSIPSFDFHGRIIMNHDSELRSYPGADGLKTGYTIASGHNLITSAMRDGVRLIGVEFGAPSNGVRDVRMTAMLNAGYESMGVQVGRAVMVAARMPSVTRMRVPSLISAAHAEEVPHAPPAPIRTVSHTTRIEPSSATIQVGSFRSKVAAQQAAMKAHAAAPSGDVRISPSRTAHGVTWRAELVGMSSGEAHEACTTLAHRHTPCIVTRSASASDLSRS